MTHSPRPHIAILGAGPTGLEAALAAAEAGFPFTVYEAGDRAAASVAGWGHVRLFSPWELDVSPRACRALEAAGRRVPEGAGCPTGAELVDEVLAPVAALPAIADRLRLATRVVEVSRDGLVKSDEIGTGRRAGRPFRLLVENGAPGHGGGEGIERADVVLDCSGTWGHPNRLGDGGIPAPGERELDGVIVRHLPDLAGDADGWAGRTVLLVGGGHSAQTAVRDLAALAARRPGTRVVWALRGEGGDFGRIADDPLAERARLADDAAALAGGASPAVEVHRGVVVEALAGDGGLVRALLRRGDGSTFAVATDRVLSLTGYVGDDRLYRQLQVHECYATSGPMKLSAALLGAAAAGGQQGGADCLAQTGHGVETLVNPEPGFFLLGAKSYGRNTTFLMRAGWGQVDEVFGLLTSAG